MLLDNLPAVGMTPSSGLNGIISGTNQSGAVIYVIAPKRQRLSVQAHRPLVLNISDSFQTEIHDKTIMAKRSGSVANLSANIMQSDEIYRSAAPSMDPDAFMDINAIATDAWQFVLILNNPPMIGRNGTPTNFTGGSRHRVLHYGYFLNGEEPVNRMTMMAGTPTINPNATLVVTHKTVTQTMVTQGQNGGQRFTMRGDDQIIQCGTIPLFVSGGVDMKFIDPNTAAQGVISDAGGSTFMMPSGSLSSLSKFGGPQAKESKLVQPLFNIMHTANACVEAIRSEATHNTISGYATDTLSPELSAGAMQPTFDEMLSKNMSPSRSFANIAGLQENETLTMGMLIQRFNPEVQPIIPEQTSMFAASDQTERSPRVLFSDLITSSGPSIIAGAGIATLIVEWETFDSDMLILTPASRESIRVHHVETFENFDPILMNQRVDAVIHELRRSIVQLMMNTRGAFSMMLSLNCIGNSYVTLNFKCDSQSILEPYEKPSSLDGLVSGLFGSADHLIHNTQEISKIITAMRQDGDYTQDLSSAPSQTLNLTGNQFPGQMQPMQAPPSVFGQPQHQQPQSQNVPPSVNGIFRL